MNDFGIWNVDFGGFSKLPNRKSKIILTRINFKIQIVGKEGARINNTDHPNRWSNLFDGESRYKETNYGEFDPGSG